MKYKLTGIIERAGAGCVSLCSEMDAACQGKTVESAMENLIEALKLFFETASSVVRVPYSRGGGGLNAAGLCVRLGR